MAAPLNEALVFDAERPLSANLNDSSGLRGVDGGRARTAWSMPLALDQFGQFRAFDIAV